MKEEKKFLLPARLSRLYTMRKNLIFLNLMKSISLTYNNKLIIFLMEHKPQ